MTASIRTVFVWNVAKKHKGENAMKKTIKTVDEKKKIVQITIEDERWYSKPNPEKEEELIYVPSVTWITQFYPKGVAFHKWLASKGWNEAEAIKLAAGDKGSKVHYAIADLIDGKQVNMDAKYSSKETGADEPLSLQEYECLMSFVNWWKAAKPSVVAREIVVFDDLEGYAGTLDLLCKIPRLQTKKEAKEGKEREFDLWLIDFKTSPNIWPSFELQVSAYKNALMEMLLKEEAERQKEDPKDDGMDITAEEVTKIKFGILQVGYRRTQKGYKFTEVEDCYNLFLSTKAIWAKETAGQTILKKDYPIELTLNEKTEGGGK